jgi:hypothetical protein
MGSVPATENHPRAPSRGGRGLYIAEIECPTASTAADIMLESRCRSEANTSLRQTT